MSETTAPPEHEVTSPSVEASGPDVAKHRVVPDPPARFDVDPTAGLKDRLAKVTDAIETLRDVPVNERSESIKQVEDETR